MACGGCRKARDKMKKLVVKKEVLSRDESLKTRAEARRERAVRRNARIARRNAIAAKIAKRNLG